MHFIILKMIAASGFLTAPECTEFDFGRGSAPDTAGGVYCAPPDPLAGLRGLLLRGIKRGERDRKGGEEGRGRGRGETGNGGNGRQGVGMPGEGREREKKEGRKVRTPLRQFLPTPLLSKPTSVIIFYKHSISFFQRYEAKCGKVTYLAMLTHSLENF